MADDGLGISGCNSRLAHKDALTNGLHSGAEGKFSLSPALVAQYPALADMDFSTLHHTEGQVTIAQPTKFDMSSSVYCDPPIQGAFPPLAPVYDSEQAAATTQHQNKSLGPESVAFPDGSVPTDWAMAPQFIGHRRTPSEYSDVSVSSVASCSTFSTFDTFDSIEFLLPEAHHTLHEEFLSIRSISLGDPILNQPSTASSPRLLPQEIKYFGPPFDNAGSGEGKATGSLSKSKVNTEPLPHLVERIDSSFEPLKLEINPRPENLSAITQRVYGSSPEDLSPAEPIDPTPEPGKNLETLSARASAERSESPSSDWEEETDWDESDSNYSGRSGVFTALDYARKYQDDDRLSAPVKPLLTPAKQRLVDRIMQEFWILFDQDWIGNVRSCTGSVSVSESGRTSISDSASNSGQDQSSPKIQRASKRSREQGQEEDPDDRDPPDPKRLKKDLVNLDKSNCKFACPYRKSNPRKYCVQGVWKSCALTPLETIARVKYEHLIDNVVHC